MAANTSGVEGMKEDKFYRVQLPPDARYSEWFDFNTKCPYDYVLSVHCSSNVTWNDMKRLSELIG